jgi:hypothetical protein
MKKNLIISVWFTLVTTLMFGLIYPLAITGLAQVLFHDRANGQLVEKDGKAVAKRFYDRVAQPLNPPLVICERPFDLGPHSGGEDDVGGHSGVFVFRSYCPDQGDQRCLRCAIGPNTGAGIDGGATADGDDSPSARLP